MKLIFKLIYYLYEWKHVLLHEEGVGLPGSLHMGPYLDGGRLYHRCTDPRIGWSQLPRVSRRYSHVGTLQLCLNQFGVTYYLLCVEKKALQLRRHQHDMHRETGHPHPLDPQLVRVLLSRSND